MLTLVASLSRAFAFTIAASSRRNRSRRSPVGAEILETRALLAAGLHLVQDEEVAPGVFIQRTTIDVADAPQVLPPFDGTDSFGGAGLQFNLIPAVGMPQQAIDGFTAAGNLWSSILTDDILVNISINFTALGPGVLGSASSTTESITFANYRTALTADATSVDDITATANLPAGPNLSLYTSSFSSGTPGTPFVDNNGTNNNSTLNQNTSLSKALGLRTGNNVTVDASITFSDLFTWDFDRSNGIASGAFDFIGVAAHEIGHALGFRSGADTVDSTTGAATAGNKQSLDSFRVVTGLDLFRFSAASEAAGADLDLRADTATKYFSIDGGITQLATFSQGRINGDGQQASHWKDNLSIGILDPTASNGEYADITDLDVQAFDVMGWNVRMDFGDAPDTGTGTGTGNYQSNLSDNGARHRLFSASGLITDPSGVAKVFLGSAVGHELNSLQNANATGDGADDGVTISTLAKGQTVNIPVNSTGGVLNYFVDFNQNGVFTDAGESFLANVAAGAQSVNIAVPAGAATGPTFARFRLSTNGGLGPNGPAANGEVEDYRVIIEPPSIVYNVVQRDGATTVFENGNPGTAGVDGKTDSFTVVLGSQPTSDVVLGVTSADTGEATVSAASLTFTPLNWNTPQTINVSGVFDNLADGNQTINVTLAVNDALSDDAYDALADQLVSVTVVDSPNRPIVTGITGETTATPTIIFNSVGGATGYTMVVLDISSSPAVEVFRDATIPGAAASYLIPGSAGLVANRTYRAFLFAANGANNYSPAGGLNGSFTQFTVGGAPTAPPAKPVAASTSGAVNRPTIHWAASASPSAESYSVYLVNLNTGLAVAPAITGPTTGLVANSFTPASDIADGRYRIFVSATNAAGNSGFGAPFDFTVGAPITVPNSPTGISANSSNPPTVSWTSSPGATSYNVYLVNRATNAVVASNQGLTQASFTTSAAIADGPYRIYVSATNVAGTSAFSAPYDFVVGAPISVPGVPTGLNVTGLNTLQPTISWNAVSHATTYAVYFINRDTGALVSSVTNLTITSFTPSSPLTRGVNYRIWVRAINVLGSSAFSAPLDFKLDDIFA